MKKYLNITVFTLLLGVVAVVSSSNGQDSKKKKKTEKKTMVVTIEGNDTTVNGKNFRDLSPAEKKEFLNKTGDMKIKMERDMKKLNEEMKELNSEIIIMNKDLTKELEDRDGEHVVRVYKHKGPKAPKAPHILEFGDLPDVPEVPELPHFEFSHDGLNTFMIRSGEDEGQSLQSFVYNDGNKKTVIKLMKASEKDLKKIGASKDDEIKMLPNPAKEELSLSFNFSEAAPVTINIYDNEGKLKKTETIKDYNGGSYEKTYKIVDFENGMYIVEFVQKNQKIVRKLSINH